MGNINRKYIQQSKIQTKALLILAQIIGECVHAAGEDGIPSGHLYARLMEKGVNYEAYCRVLSALRGAGMISEDGSHMLKWTGTK